MKKLAVVLLMLLCGVAAAQNRGIVIPPPTPVNPSALEAELASLQPLWSSGGDWSALTVTAGLSYKLPQAKGLEILCPDRIVGFVGKDTPAFDGKMRVGGTIDWELVPNISAYVGGVAGLGMSAGIKASLLNVGF